MKHYSTQRDQKREIDGMGRGKPRGGTYDWNRSGLRIVLKKGHGDLGIWLEQLHFRCRMHVVFFNKKINTKIADLWY